jgi:hypothetical protein
LSEKLKELKAVENSDEETVEDGDDAVVGSGDMTLDDPQPSTSKVAAGKQPEGEYIPHNNQQAKLLWILGLLDQDRLTFGHDSQTSTSSSASVMELLQSLSTAC